MSDSEGFDLWALATGEEPVAVEEPVSTETDPAPAEDTPLPEQQETPETVSEVTTPPVSETQPTTSAAPAFDPNDPAQNPHLADAEAMRQLRAQAVEIKRVRDSEELVSEIKDLADGDPERERRLQSLLGRIATPLSQQSQQMSHRANTSEKTLAAIWIAAEAHLTPDQRAALLAEAEDLMQVEGADVMKQRVSGKLESRQAHQAALTAKDTEIEELRRQLAARSELQGREASGADLVDGGTGTVPLDTDPIQAQRDAKDMDEYWSVWPGMRQTA